MPLLLPIGFAFVTGKTMALHGIEAGPPSEE